MASLRISIRRGLSAMLLGGLAAGCEGLHPYRTSGPQANVICNPDAQYNVPEYCRTSVVEHGHDYDLSFTEFTDQGLQYPSQNPEWGTAAYQIDETIKGLKQIADGENVKGISVVLFVHGWKHNANHDDGNVRSFRALLQSAALVEQARGSDYRVVGIYVGWRGLSVKGEPLANVSFWARKATAHRVAEGSPRELFNRLRSFKCAQNRASSRERGQIGRFSGCSEQAGNSSQTPKVRMLMIGHSFGGWILYNAVAGSLIESLTHENDTGDPNTTNMRYADMMVLLNPAFEASRYTPLHRIATSPTAKYPRYQAPLLVSVTSAADWATRRAFPVGRFINTIFENAAGDEERVATKYTMRHMPEYVTHKLRATDERPRECANWMPLSDISDPEERKNQARLNLKAETANTLNFRAMRQTLNEGWQRTFCGKDGGVQLTQVQFNPNSAIWNVYTNHTIMNGHNDIENPNVREFLRQLYQDTLPVASPSAGTVGRAATRR